MALPTGVPWAYTPPLSLWKLVEQYVSPEEQDEIKSMLGTSLVETTMDLHNEVNMLLEIWQDYQEETELENSNVRPLAEPPHVRERLIQEICFLAESVKEKSACKGMNPASVLSWHNSQILEYAEETKRSGSSLGAARCLSARSDDGRQTPVTPLDDANGRSALSSAISKEVSSANNKLNYLQFEEVCNRLRDTLEKEMEQLEADVIFLHSCLDDAADLRSHGNTPTLSKEPTISELRQERTLLEKELLYTENLPRTPQVHKPPFVPPTDSSAIKLQNLGPINPSCRPLQAGSDKEISKTKPMKASHDITRAEPSHGNAPADSPDRNAGRCKASYNPNTDHAGSSQYYYSHPQGNSLAECQTSNQTEYSSRQTSYQKSSENYLRKKQERFVTRQSRSPGRFKVVQVGSIVEPRADSAGSRSLIPTPSPTEETPRLSRPNSAQRFRKMVMEFRDST